MVPFLKLFCFGPFYAEINQQSLSNFRTQKTKALLAYLALEGSRPLHRTQLANLFWHGYQPATALASLRVSLGNLRQLLAPLDPITATRQTIQWSGGQPQVWCDVLEFSALLSSPASLTAAQLQAALQLYNGDLLEGYEEIDSQPFQEWLTEQRAHYRAQAEQLRQRLATLSPSQPLTLRHNLPRTFTSLIGRDTQITEVRQLLLDAHQPLVTLLGEGGIGKTRLAVAVAQSIYDATAAGGPNKFPDGLWFVSLIGVTPTPALPAADTPASAEERAEEAIAAAIGKAVGCSFTGGAPLRHQLCDQLQAKALLLVLDNFEHLATGRNLIVTILQRIHGISILVTTRQRLHLQAEYIYRVTELPVPAPTKATPGQLKVAAYPGVALFVARASHTTAGFTLTPDNQMEVIEICHRLGGVPLALELAAAQIETHTPGEILRNLRTSLTGLATDLADIAPRHRELRQVLITSWRLLNPVEAQILAHCSVFQGGFTLAAVAAVCANVTNTLDEQRLTALIDKSLLQRAGEDRYLLHEMVRQYAAEQLQTDEPAHKNAHRSHADYFVALLQKGFITISSSPDTLKRLQADLDNIRSAWKWLVAEANYTGLARALLPLAFFLLYSGSIREMSILIESALVELRSRVSQPLDPMQRRTVGLLQAIQAYFDAMLGRISEATTLAHAARQIGEELADGETQMWAYLSLNIIARIQGRLDVEQAKQAVAFGRRYADQPPHLIVQLLGDLGRTLAHHGQINEAIITYEEGIRLAQHYQVHLMGSVVLNMLSHLQARLGHWVQAYQLAHQALSIHQLWGYGVGIINSLLVLTAYAYAIGDYDQALQLSQQVLTQSRARQSYESEFLALVWQSKALARLGQMPAAQRNLTAAAVLSEKLGNHAYQAWVQVELGRVALHQDDWSTVETASTAFGVLEANPKVAEYRPAAQILQALLWVHKGDHAGAHAQVTALLTTLPHPDHTLQPYEAAWVYATCYQYLVTNQDPRAQQVLDQARLWLQAQAAKISEVTLRQVFLINVPEHRLLASAELGIGNAG